MYDRRVACDRIPPGAIVEDGDHPHRPPGIRGAVAQRRRRRHRRSTVGAVRPRRQPRRLRDRLAVVAHQSPHRCTGSGDGVAGARRSRRHRPRLPRIRPRPPRPVLGDPAPGREQRQPRRRRPGAARRLRKGVLGRRLRPPTPPTSPLATPAAHPWLRFCSSMRPGRLPDTTTATAICSGCSTAVSTGPGRELVVMVGTVRIALLGVVVAALMTAASGAAGRRGGRTRRRRGRRSSTPRADATDRRLSRSPRARPADRRLASRNRRRGAADRPRPRLQRPPAQVQRTRPALG